MKGKPERLGETVGGLIEPEKVEMQDRFGFRQEEFEEHLPRPGGERGSRVSGIGNLDAGQQVVLTIRFASQACRELCRPDAAFSTEFLDIRFSEVLGRPVGLDSDVASKKAIVVLLRERLVTERGQRALTGGPLPACRLAAQAPERSGGGIQCNGEVSAFE